MTIEEVDKIMEKVRHPYKYVFENLRPKPTEPLTKEDWEAWVIRHPRISGSLIEGTDFKNIIISDKHIPIKREPKP